MTLPLIAIVTGLTLAGLAGWLINRRSGTLRETGPASRQLIGAAAALGLSGSGPTIVHFSAPWCGPCVRVRRVVEQVCAELETELEQVAHLEIDLDSRPEVARQLAVLSLPTTLIFDATGVQRYRATGVPTATDLRSALKPLLA